MIRAVVFDIDGCLMNTAEHLVCSLKQALLETGGDAGDETAMRAALGLPGVEITSRFSPPDPEKTLERWCLHYAKLVPENRPFDGILELLEGLKRRGYPLGVVTSQSREINRREFSGYPIAPYFSLVVCADDVAHPKPAADPLLRCAEVFSVKPEEILYVGDAVYDMCCARNAGALGALAVWGTADPTIPADFYPKTPMEILELL